MPSLLVVLHSAQVLIEAWIEGLQGRAVATLPVPRPPEQVLPRHQPRQVAPAAKGVVWPGEGGKGLDGLFQDMNESFINS